MFASFYAKSVTLEGDVLTFTGVSKDLTTSLGKAEIATAFAPGKFPADTKADGVITGMNAEDKTVTTALRFIDPVFENDVLKVKVAPLAKDATPLLEGGYVTKALANPAYTPMSPELKVRKEKGSETGGDAQPTRENSTPRHLSHTHSPLSPLSSKRPPR